MARPPKTTVIPVPIPGAEGLRIADEATETKAAQALLDEKEKHEQEKEGASAAGGNPDDLEKVLASLSERKMLGLSEYYTVGRLSLPLVAMSIRDQPKFYQVINFWPLLVTMAALTEEPKKGSKWADIGFDPALVAALQSRNTRAQIESLREFEAEQASLAGRDATELDDPEEATPESIIQQFRLLPGEIGSYTDAICRTSWLLLDTAEPVKVKGRDGGITALTVKSFEEWENLLLSHLSVPLLVPLLRSILSASGGFPGDIADRFETP